MADQSSGVLVAFLGVVGTAVAGSCWALTELDRQLERSWAAELKTARPVKNFTSTLRNNQLHE